MSEVLGQDFYNEVQLVLEHSFDNELPVVGEEEEAA